MKFYETPYIEIVIIENDIITASPPLIPDEEYEGEIDWG